MKIGNINRKLIAGILAVAFMTAGCGSESRGMPTETTAKGEVVCSTAEFDDIRNWKVVVFDFYGEKTFWLVEKEIEHLRYGNSIYYYNAFGGNLLEGTDDLEVISEGDLLSYLVIYDKIQSEYTEEELKEILEQIKADFEKQEEKIKELEH